MDILISSNLERLVYKIAGNDAEMDVALMKALSADGNYEISSEMKAQLEDFYGNYASEAETAEEIFKVYDDTGYVLDTHTAVASAVYGKYVAETGDTKKAVIASTASPYKFAPAVMKAIFDLEFEDEYECTTALEAKTGVPMPAPLKALADAEVLHTDVIDRDDMTSYVETVVKEMFS